VQVVGVNPSRRVAGSLVIQILRVIKSLKLTQPKESRHRGGVAARRATAHKNITEWISSMLVPYTEGQAEEHEKQGAKKVEDTDKKSVAEAEKVDAIRFDHFGKFENTL
jgi:hypothetical protein